MTVINLKQGSQEWLDWRKTKITASEIPIILGKSKWCTPLELWRQKFGFTSGFKDNVAMKRGRELEPVVRDLFNDEYNARFEPEVMQHSELEWAAASLDGIDREYETPAILEIKCPGLADHQTAKNGKIPEHYKGQLLWQMFCSDIDLCFYVSYYNEEMIVVRVEKDNDYIANTILPAAAEFYRCIVEVEEPNREESDYIQIVDPNFENAVREWEEDSNMAKQFADKEKKSKEKLISFTDDSNCCGYGVKITRVNRDGAIDWKKLYSDLSEKFPEAAEQHTPEAYRKEQIGYWKISEDKN